MSSQEQRRAWLINALKLTLPLVALAVLSTLFLFPRNIDPTRALPYAEVDIEELTRDPRLSMPRFSGMTEDGTAMTLSARAVRAIPRPEGDSMEAEGIFSVLESADGQRTEIEAGQARLDPESGMLVLDGDVLLQSAAGYALRTKGLRVALDQTWLESDHPVIGTGPIGQITAGKLLIRSQQHDADGPESHVLVFTQGVQMIYQP